MDIVTAGASSSNSSEYSKNPTSASDNEVKSGGKSKICDDFGKERNSSYSKNLKEISYGDMSPGGKSKMYEDFTKKGLSQSGLMASAGTGSMFAPKAK